MVNLKLSTLILSFSLISYGGLEAEANPKNERVIVRPAAKVKVVPARKPVHKGKPVYKKGKPVHKPVYKKGKPVHKPVYKKGKPVYKKGKPVHKKGR